MCVFVWLADRLQDGQPPRVARAALHITLLLCLPITSQPICSRVALLQAMHSLSTSIALLVFFASGIGASLYPTSPVQDTVFHGGGWNDVTWKDPGSAPSLDDLGRLSIDLFIDRDVAVSGCPFLYSLCWLLPVTGTDERNAYTVATTTDASLRFLSTNRY